MNTIEVVKMHHWLKRTAWVSSLYKLRYNREQMISFLVDEQLAERLSASLDRYINQSLNDVSWLKPIGVSPETAITAPEGGYLLLGDNSIHSWDSRNWGFVPEQNLRGSAVAAYLFPFNLRSVE